jgi:hypothetical protein
MEPEGKAKSGGDGVDAPAIPHLRVSFDPAARRFELLSVEYLGEAECDRRRVKLRAELERDLAAGLSGAAFDAKYRPFAGCAMAISLEGVPDLE